MRWELMSALTVLVLFLSAASHACRGGNATSSVARESEVHVSYHGPLGLHTACVLCSGSLCQLSLLWQPPSTQVWLCYHSTYRSTGLSRAMGCGTHPTLVRPSSGPMRWAKPGTPRCVVSGVLRGPLSMMYPYGLPLGLPKGNKQTWPGK
jgi:hypothetical protein